MLSCAVGALTQWQTHTPGSVPHFALHIQVLSDLTLTLGLTLQGGVVPSV